MMEQCKEKLNIAMFGQKRIPSREGGVEIVVEELCSRMVAQGHNVTCYNRGGHHVSGSEYDSKRLKEYKGIRLKTVPTIEKKKILYIVEAMGGGVFTYIVDLANELVNKYDMYIAYAVRKQTPKNYKDYFDKRIHLIEVKNFGRAINPTKDIAAFFEVKKIAAEVKPDVIHLHSSKAGAIGRVAFDGKIPMFYTPHGYSFLMENCNPTKRRVFKLIESVCAKRNCTTISCSVGEHQETLKLTKNAAYVNNGINMKELQEIVNQTEKVAHPFTVFTLGRICYQKNPTLFNTIAELLPDVRFVWIGDGELREELPISLLESMYMRKVCVVSNVIGNRDVIHNGENGFVCSNTEEFVKAIKEAQNGADGFTERAYQDVLNMYNTKAMAKQYSEKYDKSINTRGTA